MDVFGIIMFEHGNIATSLFPSSNIFKIMDETTERDGRKK